MNLLDVAARQTLHGGRIGAFHGAEYGRLTRSWHANNVSPDYELRMDLRTLRARSRQQARDNPWVNGMLWTSRANIFGPTGIGLQVRLRTSGKWWDTTGAFDQKANADMEAFWKGYCEDPELVSVDGRMDWMSQSWFAEYTKFIDGEHFEFRDFAAANEFGYALQTIDPDQLDEGYNVAKLPNGNQIRMGVEVDPKGRIVAYHFWDQHPNDLIGGVKTRQRIPADRILHYFEPHRRNAVRGIPALTSALYRLRQSGKHEEAELVASVVSSSKMGWLQTNDTYVGGEDELNPDGSRKDERVEMEAEPGLVSQLPPGWEFKEWDPQHPTTAFTGFQKAMMRGIGISVGMAYASTTGDLSDVNYSSIRAGLLTERDIWRMKQTFHASRYPRVVFRDVVRMAALRGILPIPDERIPELFRSVVWQGRGWRWVDPVNDLQALKLAIALGVGSRTAACADQGIDYEENLQLLEHELQMAKLAGVPVSGEDSAGQSVQVQPRHDGSGTQDDDEEDDSNRSTPQRKALRAVR